MKNTVRFSADEQTVLDLLEEIKDSAAYSLLSQATPRTNEDWTLDLEADPEKVDDELSGLALDYPDVYIVHDWRDADDKLKWKDYGLWRAELLRRNKAYEPNVLFDAAGMDHKEWETKRREERGIGGSEQSTAQGDNPHNTNIEGWLWATGTPRPPVDEITQFLFDMGHKMEEMVAKAFVIRHPEWELVVDTRMFRHSLVPFMTGNVDYLLRHKETGEIALLECKYVTPDSEFMWRKDPPVQYVWQARHYMSVLNIRKSFIAALWGNHPFNHGVDHMVLRDMDIEEEMILVSADYWRCIQEKRPPKLRCHKTDALKAFLASNTPSHALPQEVVLDEQYAAIAARYTILKDRSKNANAQAKAAEGELKEAEAQLLLALGDHQIGVVTASDGTRYRISAKPKDTNVLDMNKLQTMFPSVYASVGEYTVTLGNLKSASREAYQACVTTVKSETGRTFKVTRLEDPE